MGIFANRHVILYCSYVTRYSILFYFRFQHTLPETTNVIGVLANANFMASIATTFIILAFASPKKVVKSDDDITRPRPELRRSSSSYYEVFTRNAKTAILSLNTRAYVGLVFEGLPLLVFAIIYPTLSISIALSVLVGVGEALVQSGIWYVVIEYISYILNR